MGGSSKKGGKMEVTDYRLSLHYGLCHGPIDALTAIITGEKAAWTGDVTTETAIGISRTDLFGGPKKEGGVAGVAYLLPGGPEQLLPEDLATRLGKTPATAPGYRNIASVFMVGSPASYGSEIGVRNVIANVLPRILGTSIYGGAGFLWGSNNPYLKGSWFTVRRSPKVLASHLRMIGSDANPAAIIYECLVNRDWGMGGSPTTIDTASFTAAGEVLLLEEFGLSLQWTKQATIEDFVAEILDHIQATLFINPRTGLMTIKLIRGDYYVPSLPVLNPDNCHITAFDRKVWGETINEIVVTWTNPENEQEETIIAQNLANITIQGAVISDSRNYYGVRNADLAMTLAQRDLASASSPIASYEIEADRSAWDFVPGGCAVLNYPEYGINGLVLRIGKIDYGKPGDPTIKVSAFEDIFANPSAAFDSPGAGQWVDPAEEPTPMEFVRVITAPTYFVSRRVSAGDISVTEYPEVLAAVLASQTGSDTPFYELIGQTVAPNGTITAEPRGTKIPLGYTTLIDALPAETESLIPEFDTVLGGPGPRVATFMIIGNKAESGQEIALIQSSDEDGWVIKRGVLDTVPRPWPADTGVWFVSASSDFIDTAVYSAAQEVNYKLLSVTSKGTLTLAEAPLNGAVLSARPHLPNRPAKVSVAGTMFGTVDLSATSPMVVAVTWANRNRTLEDAQVLAWDEDGLPPEVGQTTTVRVVDTDGNVVTTHAGLTGESFDIPIASFTDLAVCDVKVSAVRDGLESLQGHVVRVKIRDGGWGDGWGDSWGATSVIVPGDPDPGDPGTGYEPDPGGDFPPYRDNPYEQIP